MSVMWSMTSSSIMAMVSGAGVSSPKPYIIGATASDYAVSLCRGREGEAGTCSLWRTGPSL